MSNIRKVQTSKKFTSATTAAATAAATTTAAAAATTAIDTRDTMGGPRQKNRSL